MSVAAYCFEANHFHMFLKVLDPEDVKDFVGFVKQEIAHRVNKLLGRRKRTIWAEGYDSPPSLELSKALANFVYVLINPVKDNIVRNMDDYAGVSSWIMFRDERFSFKCKRIARDTVPTLKDPTRPWREDSEVCRTFDKEGGKNETFMLSPYAWKTCFEETRNLTDTEFREMILEKLKEEQERVEEERIKNKVTKFHTRYSLVHQSMVQPYKPEKRGKRMMCHSNLKEIRIQFISFIRSLIKEAKEVKEAWERGDYSIPFPPGLFPPGRRPMASLLCNCWY